MIVEVSSDSGETFDDIGRLNPYSDPVLLDRHHLPFTSGSFNIVANWIPVTVDLSDYRSDEAQIQFSFLTIDPLYNGFREWLIDNVKVIESTDLNLQGYGLTTDLEKRTPR